MRSTPLALFSAPFYYKWTDEKNGCVHFTYMPSSSPPYYHFRFNFSLHADNNHEIHGLLTHITETKEYEVANCILRDKNQIKYETKYWWFTTASIFSEKEMDSIQHIISNRIYRSLHEDIEKRFEHEMIFDFELEV